MERTKFGFSINAKSCLKERLMIELTKMNGQKILVNVDLIETVEETPDTVLTLLNGKKIIVKEHRQEVKNLVKSFKRDIYVN